MGLAGGLVALSRVPANHIQVSKSHTRRSSDTIEREAEEVQTSTQCCQYQLPPLLPHAPNPLDQVMGQEKKALGGSLAAAQGIPHAGVIINSEVSRRHLRE